MSFEDPYGQGPVNPFAPPAAGPAPGVAPHYTANLQILASPGIRLGARMLDSLLITIAAIPWFVVWFNTVEAAGVHFDRLDSSPEEMMLLYAAFIEPNVLLAMLPMFALMAYQWYLISTRGQTLAKRWLKIQIVRQDGTPVDFVSGVILRNWIIAFLGGIPYIGGCISIADALMIFGEGHECLHDRIASTKVIAKLFDDAPM